MFPSSLDERADHFLVVVFDICACCEAHKELFLGRVGVQSDSEV